MKATSRNVVQVVSRGGADLDKALLGVLEALVTEALTDYRMAGFPQPGRPERRTCFGHLFAAGSHLALCRGLAVARPERLRPAKLCEIDCVACLDAFTERTRP